MVKGGCRHLFEWTAVDVDALVRRSDPSTSRTTRLAGYIHRVFCDGTDSLVPSNSLRRGLGDGGPSGTPSAPRPGGRGRPVILQGAIGGGVEPSFFGLNPPLRWRPPD
jgi:hypothetical protein